jgi:hypothetical protein
MADDLMLLDLHDEGLAEVPQFAATSASSPPKQERVRAKCAALCAEKRE